MQPIAHPSENGAGLSRMVGWSAGLHLMVLTVIVVMDLIRPRPTVFRDVIRVDLVAPPPPIAEPKPEPKPEPPKKPELPPLEENPLWQKLDRIDSPRPQKSDKPALAEMWEDYSKAPPKPKPRPKQEDLAKWWDAEMRQARRTPPPDTPEPVKIPERERLADAWKQINATLPEAVRIGEAETQEKSQGELNNWWKRQMDMAVAPAEARQAVAASDMGNPEYRDLVQQRVAVRWSPPDIFRDRRTVIVTLAWQLTPDGHVRSLKVVESSGSSFYDQAAIRAVFLSDPFPPFPPEFNETDTFRMTFSLDRGRLG